MGATHARTELTVLSDEAVGALAVKGAGLIVCDTDAAVETRIQVTRVDCRHTSSYRH